jgi:Concanavalin A-like lectin/glucanases superfamily
MKTREPRQTYRAVSRLFAQRQTRLRRCGILAGAILLLLHTSPARALLADYQSAVTNEPGLISYYTFEQGDASDAYGTNNGTLMGTTVFTNGVGGAGKALLLGGAGRVDLGVVDAFAFPAETGSVEAWVQAGNLGGNGCMAANRDVYSRWSLHMNSDKGGIGMWNGAAYFPTIPIPNAGTAWHHMVAVFDAGNFTLYWDGALAGTVARPLGYTDVTQGTQLGSNNPGAQGEAWVGMLDEVALYSTALTPQAVQAHYLAFFAGNPPTLTRQPQSGSYLPGVALTLSVQASGPSLSYQWYKAASVLPGANASTFAFPSLAAGDAGTYSVVVTNVAGAVTSAPAVIALSATLPPALVRYQSAVSNEASLISYYTFDRLLPQDVVGPNQGTLSGTAGFGAGVGGGPGQGLMLDGSGHVRLGSVPAFDFASGVGTVEGWIRGDWTTASGWPCMFADRNGDPTVWSLHLSSAKDIVSLYNGVGSSWFIPPANLGTTWHHIAVVFTNGTASVFLDGALLPYSPMPFTMGFGSGTVQLGSSSDSSTTEGWMGMLDEVAFYSAALPAASIQAHYNAFYLGQPPAITAEPVGGYFLTGQPFQMSVGASGAQLTYQWYKGNAPIPSATNAVIGSASLTPDDTGIYYVAVTNPSGTTNSATAYVQVGNDIARYQAAVLSESSLLSYYTFDAGDASDAKNAHPGTPAGAVTFSPGPGGVTNLALTLDGSSHIDLGQVADFDFASGSGTVEGWLRPNWSTPAAYNPTFVADRSGGSDWSIHMDQWQNAMGNWNNDRFQEMSIPNAAGWHYYAIVFDQSLVTMYWDGKPLGTFPQPINLFSGLTTQIGSSAPTTTAEGWMGGLDEIALYGTALDAGTIWNHFLAMVGPPSLSYAPAGTQLTLYWPLDVTGYTLEYAESLPATSWTPVTGVVSNRVTLAASLGQRFFRLSK